MFEHDQINTQRRFKNVCEFSYILFIALQFQCLAKGCDQNLNFKIAPSVGQEKKYAGYMAYRVRQLKLMHFRRTFVHE